MPNANSIVIALGQLDIANEAHWTSDGLPVIDVMKTLLGASVTRAEITAAAKGFNRKNPVVATPAPVAAPAQTDFAGTNAAPEPVAEPVAATSDAEQGSIAVTSTADEDPAVQKELDSARAALHLAQERFRNAQSDMDVLIRARVVVNGQVSQAHAIKAYQESQRMQREANVANQNALADLIKRR